MFQFFILLVRNKTGHVTTAAKFRGRHIKRESFWAPGLNQDSTLSHLHHHKYILQFRDKYILYFGQIHIFPSGLNFFGKLFANIWICFPIHSLGSRECIGKYYLCRSYHSISSLLQVNTIDLFIIYKYIPKVWWILTVLKSISEYDERMTNSIWYRP